MIFCKETDLIQTPIGLVPNDWEVAQISDIAEINKESRDPSRESPDVTFQYVDIESVTGGSERIKKNKKTLGKEAPSRARRVIHENDVLMSTVRPYLKAFTIVPKWYDNEICSTGFAVLTSKENVDPRFLLHTLFSDNVISQCNRMMVGGQYPALNSSQVAEIKLPLPPMPEQRAIVRVLDVVDSTIELTDNLIAKTERLKKGLMQQLLTHGIGHTETKQTPIGNIPKGWEPISLSKVFKLSSGKPRPANISVEASPEAPYPIYGGNGVLGYSSKFLLNRQTIVIGRVGEYCGAVYKSSERSWITDNALYATELSNNFDITFLKYLLSFMNLNKFQKKMGQPLITQTILYGIDVPRPPLAEQLKIVDVLSTADRKLELENKERLRLETIKWGLMDLLLTGKVRIKVD